MGPMQGQSEFFPGQILETGRWGDGGIRGGEWGGAREAVFSLVTLSWTSVSLELLAPLSQLL